MRAIESRYEVGLEDICIEEHCKTKAEAIMVAIKVKSRNPEEKIYIFDRMAKKGSKNLWYF